MKCLVTGAAGFIGSHLTDLLLAEGHEVIAVDDLSTGRPANLEGARRHRGFTWIEADIADPRAIADLPAADWVFHIAGRADLVPSIEKPDDYFRVNVNGTFLVLEYARKAAVRRFIYTASSTCYGIAEQVPTPEEYPCLPRHPYGLTKYLGEQLVMHWAQVYKLPAVSLRLFNVYGPRSRTTGTYGAVFGVFLKQKLAGKPFTVVGDGNQTRDFTYVSDIVRAFLAAAAADVSGEIFNVGSGATYSVNRLVELLGGERIFIPKRPGEPDCTFADIRKITSALAWKPQITFEEGVKRMLAVIDDWREAPLWDEEKITEATKDWFKYLR